jgi:hypothetical protein
MFGHVTTFVFVSVGLQLVTSGAVVRRALSDAENTEFEPVEPASRKRSKRFLADEISDGHAASASGTHCVAYGDWNFEGKMFRTAEEAEEFFNEKKRSELAAVQLHGRHEVHRYVSKRLNRVDWLKMKGWCGEHHSDSVNVSPSPLRNKAAAHVGRNGAITRTLKREDHEDALFQSSSTTWRRSKYNPVISSLVTPPTSVAANLDTKASTLSSKVALLENEVDSLAAKASGLFQSIGVAETTTKSSSLFQSDHHSHHHTESKLKARLTELEESTFRVQEKANLLEAELFGTSTADKSTRGESEHSFKRRIETLGGQVDELKTRFSAMESTPLLSDAAMLEANSARLGSEAARIFTSIGIETVNASAMPAVVHQPLKARLSSLEAYAENMQRNAATLEYEILGNSWNLPAASDSQRAGSIKDHATSLGDKLHDVESRISSLASAPIVADVGKMEDAVTSLSSRAVAVSKNVGINDKTSQDGLALAPQSSPLKRRMAALGGYIGTTQNTIAALEEELAGNVGTMPSQSQKDTFKSKATFMHLLVENQNARISALEQLV